MRPSKRKNNQLREISIEPGILANAEGSCLVKFGNTHVICSATIDNNLPKFLKGKNKGWVTAEYSMLPRATNQRVKREVTQGKPSGRTQEIQRLIGRSMRGAVNLKLLGERQIILDCDVINADGGTRTAAITGSYVAMALAVRSIINKEVIKFNPIKTQIAAISCGVYKNEVVVDLDYLEDSAAEVDANFVFNSDGNMIEVQATGEDNNFSEKQLIEMLQIAKDSVSKLFTLQNKVLLEI